MHTVRCLRKREGGIVDSAKKSRPGGLSKMGSQGRAGAQPGQEKSTSGQKSLVCIRTSWDLGLVSPAEPWWERFEYSQWQL